MPRTTGNAHRRAVLLPTFVGVCFSIALSGCPSTGDLELRCRSDESCPTGHACTAEGRCVRGADAAEGRVLRIVPNGVTVLASEGVKLEALLDGEPAEVKWTLSGPGTIAADGTYSAPVILDGVAEVKVTAALATAESVTATATFTVASEAPVPTLTTVAPNAVVVPVTPVQVTLTGTGFISTSVVLVGEREVAAKVASSTSIAVTLPQDLVGTAGVLSLRVKNPPPGGGISAAVSLQLHNKVPQLTTLDPVMVLAGSKGATAKIIGDDFAPGVTVTVAGIPATVTSVSDLELGVIWPEAALFTSGSKPIVVQNPGPGGGTAQAMLPVMPSIQTALGGFRGDDGPAMAAAMRHTGKIARNAAGEIFYAEPQRHRVMKIDAQGVVRRVAGTGRCGYSGDGLAAKDAELCGPSSLAFDSVGNLYVFDELNNRLRTIDAMGKIQTIAGNGSCANTGDGGPAATAAIGGVQDLAIGPDNSVYLVGCGCGLQRVRRIQGGIINAFAGTGAVGFSGDGGPATAATFNCPLGVTVSGTNKVYVADLFNDRIRRIQSGTITTVAGGGLGDGQGPGTSVGIGWPIGVTADAQDNVYFGSLFYYRAFKLSAAGELSWIAGNGLPGSAAQISGPALATPMGQIGSFAFGPNGDLFIAGLRYFGQDRWSLWKLSGGTVSMVAGGFDPPAKALDIPLFRPGGVTSDSKGNLYASDLDGDRIWKVAVDGKASVLAGNGLEGASAADGTPAASQYIDQPRGLWADEKGGVYFAMTNYNALESRIMRVDPDGVGVIVAGGGNVPAGCGATPSSPPAGAGPSYNCIGDDFLAAVAVVRGARAVVGDGAGNLYFTEFFQGIGNRVRKVDLTTGRISTLAGGLAVSQGCGFAGDGLSATSARFCEPEGIAISPAGDLIIADAGNRRLRRIHLKTAPLGVISTIGGVGGGPPMSTGDGGPLSQATFCRPTGVAYDSAGHLYITDAGCHVVRKVDAVTGNISTVAGNGIAGFGGELTEAQSAALSSPGLIWFDAKRGALLVADGDNERIRWVHP